MERRMISPGFVEDALGCLARAGIASAPVLRAAGLPQPVSGPISHLAYGRLWRAVAHSLQDEFFGLAARPMRPGGFALLGHAVLHTPTLAQALERALLFLTVVLDDPRGALSLRDGEAHIVLTDAGPPRSAFAYRTYWLILMGLACWLIGRRMALRRVDLRCPAPPQREDYHQFFGAPVRFDQPATCLSFDAAYLALPVVRDEAALEGFLRQAPANILVRYRHDQGLAQRLARQLKATPPADWPSLTALAQAWGMAPASLRRRLRAEGQSYGAIKSELRAGMARQLLAEGQASVAEIATALGYAEPSAFYRAYRGWFAASPKQR